MSTNTLSKNHAFVYVCISSPVGTKLPSRDELNTNVKNVIAEVGERCKNFLSKRSVGGTILFHGHFFYLKNQDCAHLRVFTRFSNK